MSIMNKKQFVLDSKALKIKEVLNKDFLEIEILAIAEGENRNKTSFTLESMKKAIPTFYNKFILGYFNVQGNVNNEGRFEEHNSDIKYDQELDEMYYSYLAPNAEKALGLIRESDKVEIVNVDGKNWIKLTAAILTKYNREAVKYLLKRKSKSKVSVEITINKYHTENGIDIIEDFTLDGITILGNRKNSNRECEEGIEGASMILKFLNSKIYSAQRRALSFAYQELETLGTNEGEEEITMKNNQLKHKENEEGGSVSMDNTKNVSEETYVEQQEEFACDNPTSEEEKQCNSVCDEEKCASNQPVDGEVFEDEGCKDKEDTDDDDEKDVDDKEECSACGEKSTESCGDSATCEKAEESCGDTATCEKEEVTNCGTYSDITFLFTNVNGEEQSFTCEPTSEAMQEVFNSNIQTAFNELVERYNELQEKYNSLETECNNAKFSAYGEELFAKDDTLEDADKVSLKETFVAKCNEGAFASEEEVQDYVETQIAKKVYQVVKMSKQAKNEEKKEFSAKIKNSTVDNNEVEDEASMGNMERMKKMLEL